MVPCFACSYLPATPAPFWEQSGDCIPAELEHKGTQGREAGQFGLQPAHRMRYAKGLPICAGFLCALRLKFRLNPQILLTGR